MKHVLKLVLKHVLKHNIPTAMVLGEVFNYFLPGKRVLSLPSPSTEKKKIHNIIIILKNENK